MATRYSGIFVSSGLVLLLATSVGSLQTAYANAINRVKLVATLNGQPALQGVNWIIFNINDPRNPAAVLPRHSGTVFLPAGQYRATIQLDHKIKETLFRVETEADTVIHVPMD